MMPIELKNLGLADCATTLQAMQQYTDARLLARENYADQIWNLQHPPVYTQGVAGKSEHILNPGNIPILQVNRGGQVTYHGPGQVVLYLLLDIERRHLGTRQLVALLEQAMLNFLADCGIAAAGNRDAPGVYVAGAKIGSIGLRVQKGCTYHGISFNVNNDLTPFLGINPCGYAGLQVCRLLDLCALEAVPISSNDPSAELIGSIGACLSEYICQVLGTRLVA